MPVFNVTLLFNSQKQGWSENWWWTGASQQAAQAAALAVAAARQGLLAKAVTLEAIRTSDSAVLGDSLVSLTTALAAGVVPPNLSKDNPGNAWLSRVNAGPRYRRQLWLRGAPDDWLVFDKPTGLPQIPDPLQQAFNAYMSTLVKQQMQLNVLDKDQPRTVIPQFSADAPSGLVKVTAVNHRIPNLSSVRIKGCKGVGAAVLNGVFTIQGVQTDTFLINLPASVLGGVNYISLTGSVQWRKAMQVTVTDGVILRPGTRKTGRAFFVPRGRRRARS